MNYAEVFDYYTVTIGARLAQNVDMPRELQALEGNEHWQYLLKTRLEGERDCQLNFQSACMVLGTLSGVAAVTRRELLTMLREEKPQELLGREELQYGMRQNLRREIAIQLLVPVANQVMWKLWKHNYGAAQVIDAEAKQNDVDTDRYVADELLTYLERSKS